MRFLVKFLFLLTLLVANATGAWAADGRILDYVGDVRVNGQPISTETELHRDDVIATAEGASVRIVLSDNSVLDLDSGSQVKLSDYSYHPSTPEQNKSDVNIIEGSLRYVSGLIAKENPDSVSFKAGNATIGVRGSFTAIALAGTVARVEALIGEATLKKGDEELIVPTGKTTLTDPVTGEVLVVPSTETDPVNAVVRAIAATAPDAGDSEDEGCSQGKNPLRATANPEATPEESEAIEKMLAELSEGELMMVIAVLNNNARHLCIDSSTIASTIAIIARVNPDATDSVVDVANTLDPDNSDKFNDAGNQSPNETPQDNSSGPVDTEVPPGGTPPSPE